MPIGDLQFWIVSAVAVVVVVFAGRRLWPARRSRAKTQLTISAKKK